MENKNFQEIIKKLVKLQHLDDEILSLEEEINLVPLETKKLEEEINQLQKDVELNKENIKTIQVQIKNKEIELQSLEQQVKKHTQELNSVKTNEQYKALLAEIEQINKKKDEIETDIIILMEQVESKKQESLNFEKKVSMRRLEIEQKINELKQKLSDLQLKYEQKKQERKNFVSLIDNRYLSIYEKINHTREGAMSEVVNPGNGYSCSKCGMRLTEQEISDIRKYVDFVFCNSCSRILYISQDLENH